MLLFSASRISSRFRPLPDGRGCCSVRVVAACENVCNPPNSCRIMSQPATSLTKTDRELVLQLLEDAATIESQLAFERPKPSVARATLVPILRRWIADSLFHSAQKLPAGREVRFAIRNHAKAIKLCEDGVYAHWMGMLDFGGIGVGLSQVDTMYLYPDGRSRIELDRTVNERPTPQPARSFFEQKIFFWKREFYTRSDVIKLHANVLGGVHYDPKSRRVNKKEYLHEIPNYFGFEVKGRNYQMLIGEQIAQGRADQDRRPNIYDATELIAMDTARIFSQSILSRERAFRNMLG